MSTPIDIDDAYEGGDLFDSYDVDDQSSQVSETNWNDTPGGIATAVDNFLPVSLFEL